MNEVCGVQETNEARTVLSMRHGYAKSKNLVFQGARGAKVIPVGEWQARMGRSKRVLWQKRGQKSRGFVS